MTDRIESIPALIKDIGGQQYVPGDRLGAGGFATCWRAKMIDQRSGNEKPECALKVVRAKIRSQTLAHRFQVEMQVHSKLQHPHIVEFHRAFTFQENTYIVLELCHNGSLADMVKKRKFLTMGEIRRFLIQLCGAVKYLHQRDVVHRDIKAGNIFLDNNMNVKLGDFGLSAVMVTAGAYIRRTTFCGTPNYLAPEVLNRDGSGHGASVDIWAIGVMAYYMSVGRAPFHSKSKEEIYQKLRAGDYQWPDMTPEQNEIPQDLKNLVSILLVPESERPTPDYIVSHRFFRGFIPEKLEPLVLIRRPRWARTGKMPLESSAVYDRLCRECNIGQSISVLPARKKIRSIVKALADELSFGSVQLQIPLPEDILYLGISSARKTEQISIYEESASSSDSYSTKHALATAQIKSLNRVMVTSFAGDKRQTSESPEVEVLGERSSNKIALGAPARKSASIKLLSEEKVKRPRRAGVNYDLMNQGSLR